MSDLGISGISISPSILHHFLPFSTPYLSLSFLLHRLEPVYQAIATDYSIYSPYSYTGIDASPPPTASLDNLDLEVRDTGSGPRAIVSEIFLFEYGVTVIWGMTELEEKRFLKEIAKFEVESLRTRPFTL